MHQTAQVTETYRFVFSLLKSSVQKRASVILILSFCSANGKITTMKCGISWEFIIGWEPLSKVQSSFIVL